MKKVLSLVLALVLVLGMIPTFAADATGAQALYDNGFITGKDGADLEAKLDVNAQLTRAQLAALIAELNGAKDEAAAFEQPADFTDFSMIAGWAKNFVSYAAINGWMNGYTDGTFRASASVSAQQLAAVLMNALGYPVVWNTVLADAAALGIVVEGAALTRGEAFEAMWVAVSEVKMNTTAGLTLGQFLGKLDSVPGAVAIKTAALSGTKKVAVEFNKAVDTTKAVVKVKKGAAIYSGTVTWNEAKTIATVATVIALPTGDYTAEVTGLDVTLTKTFTVAAEAASMITFSTTVLEDNTAAAKVPFAVKNQYGEEMNIFANTTGVVVSMYNVTQNMTVAPLAVGANKYFEVNTTAPDAAAFKTGDVVRVIVSYAGLNAQANLTVQQPAIAGTMSFGQLVLAKDDVRLNVADGTVKMAYVLLDQYGQPMKLADVAAANLPLTLNGVQFVSSNNAVVSQVGVVTVDKVSYLQFTVVGDGVATITAIVNASGNVASTQITVAKNGTPTTAVVTAPSMLVAAGDKAFDLALSVIDQYGDAVKVKGTMTVALKAGSHAELTGMSATMSTKADMLTINASALTVTASRTATFEVMQGTTVIGSVSIVVEPNAMASQISAVTAMTTFEHAAVYTFANADFTVLDQYGRAFTGTSVVTEKTDTANIVSFAGNVMTVAATSGTATLTVTNGAATKDFVVTSVAPADIKSYTIQTIGPVYKAVADVAYNVSVLLAGKTEAGVGVVLASENPQFITSANPGVVLVDGTAVRGQAVGTATVSAWLAGKVVATADVTVTDAAKVPTSIKINATATTGAVVSTVVSVKDQYGVVIADAGYFFIDGTLSPGGTALAAGTKTVMYVASNGITKTVDVVVTP